MKIRTSGRGEWMGTCRWPASGLCFCCLCLALGLHTCPTRTSRPLGRSGPLVSVSVLGGGGRGCGGRREPKATGGPHQVCVSLAQDSAFPSPLCSGSQLWPSGQQEGPPLSSVALLQNSPHHTFTPIQPKKKTEGNNQDLGEEAPEPALSNKAPYALPQVEPTGDLICCGTE